MADLRRLPSGYITSITSDIYGPPSMGDDTKNARMKIINSLRGHQTVDQMEIVDDILVSDSSLRGHYDVVDVVSLLRNNISGKRESEALQLIKTAVGILEKYGRNLLKPTASRPPKWKIIFFSNGVYKTKVGVVEGSKTILNLLGYTLSIADGLSFPNEVNHPDEDRVLKIVTDLMIAKVEIEKYLNKVHPHPDEIYYVLHGDNRMTSVNTDIYGPAMSVDERKFQDSSYSFGSSIYGSAPNTLPGNIQAQSQHGTNLQKEHMAAQLKGPTHSQIDGLAQVTESVHKPEPSNASSSTLVGQVGKAESIPSDGSENSEIDCNLCGEKKAAIYCKDCKNANCVECDGIWHSHPKRKSHKTEPLNKEKDKMATAAVPLKVEPQSKSFVSADDYSQTKIAAKVKRPPSEVFEHTFENLQYTPKDRPETLTFVEPHESDRKRPVATPRKDRTPSSEEPVTPLNPFTGSNLQMRSKEDKDLYTLQRQVPTSKTPEDTEELKGQLLRKSIGILEKIKLIQEKQDMILDETSDEFIVLEKERDVHMSRNESLQKRIKALDTCTPGKRELKIMTKESSISDLLHPVIKKPPVEDILSMTPKKTPESENAEPRKLVDELAKLEIQSEGSPDAKHLINPPEIYTPPQVANREPILSAVPVPAVRKNLPNPAREGNITVEPPKQTSVVDQPQQATPVIPSDNAHRIGWGCQYCTFWNTDTSSIICGMCSKTTYRDVGVPSQGGDGAPSGVAQQSTSESELITRDDMVQELKVESVVKAKSGTDKKTSFASHTMPRTKTKSEVPVSLISGLNTMTLTDMRIKTKQEELRKMGQQLVTAIRKAQNKNFDFDTIEMSVALAEQEDKSVDVWLEENHADFMETVTVIITNEINAIIPGSKVSEELLLELLHKHVGDIEKVKQEYVGHFYREMKEIEELKLERNGQTLKTDEIQAELIRCKGDVDKMIMEVQREEMQTFVSRLGKENPDMKKTFFSDPNEDQERKLRSLFAEYDLKGWIRAEHALILLNENEEKIKEDPEYFDDVIQAVKDQLLLEEAKSFLEKKCSMCWDLLPMTRMWQPIFCSQHKQCLVCKECLGTHFTICIKEKNIIDASCPSCDLPKLKEMGKADLANYFATIDPMLRSLLKPDVFDLLHQKLRDRILMEDERFRWCSDCRNGFINERNGLKMQCPECRKYSCFKCKKKWEGQHDGLTCEEFKQWKIDNDPDMQAAGLARHLEEHGIDCPKCKMRYALARGGCMHFTCTQCKHEFCSGCNQEMSSTCSRYESCVRKGIHAHHPRDCLFYLRDQDIPKLQKLLKNHKVKFDTEKSGVERNVKCTVLEQKDGPEGLVDEACGKEVKAQNAGLCQVHYKEYLVSLINEKHIDPVELFTIIELEICIGRHDMKIPERGNEPEEVYQKRLVQIVQTKFPIGK
ncbi:uncharacterized protein [Antedon mediterranea]|uniref:uncharacterized protein n=1 Tax=Antedon mediterranea TaxID=105859 RepID=UPI003AF95551